MSLQIGPYKILTELGAGGMGVVYRALDTQITREVALKRLRSEFATSPAVMQRFRNEAKLQGRLNHPGIAQLFALYQGDGATCIVMEFVDGTALKDILPLPADVGALVMIQILQALDYAHRLGVLHRDIKPENIMIDRTGCVKVMDFGIAHAVGSERMTRERSLIGTIEYMSPERILGKDVDNRSDIYALGIMLFETVAGRLPMDTVVEFELLRWHIDHDAPPISNYANVPVEFDLVIRRAMEKDTTARYATCGDMAADLARFVPNHASATVALQQAITAAKERKKENRSVDLKPIYKDVISLLDKNDLPSAERLLRHESDKYPACGPLSMDARLAAALVMSNSPNISDSTDQHQERVELFHSLLYQRLEDSSGAKRVLAQAYAQLPHSVLIRMAASQDFAN
jgi:serine/threonine protein kinase